MLFVGNKPKDSLKFGFLWDFSPVVKIGVFRMPETTFIQGEFSRKLDDRFRLSLPDKLMTLFPVDEEGDCVLVKERPGCISLWPQEAWEKEFSKRVELVRLHQQMGDYSDKLPQLQMLGRLLSTGYRPVQLAAKSRLLIPEGFREFLRVEPGCEVMVIGAAVSIEIWNPEKWVRYVERRMPKFRKILTALSHVG